ncbi:toprim domain-containing protein [Pseudophaeobacter sp. A-200-2]|uniref:DUF7146 domain-containing protein n=1 Tax=Pseudophaeobacter sp. A-200-2 TaxID=3098145 RepID=UPI0034D731F5
MSKFNEHDADARTICEALGGRWYGSYGVTFCPSHQNTRTPALSISNASDGRLLCTCGNGCDFLSEILPALQDRGLAAGDGDGRGWPALSDEAIAQRRKEEEAQACRKREMARNIWTQALPAQGSPSEAYLRGRGITVPPPESIRFSPNAFHGPSGQRLPAMISAVRIEGGRDLTGLHRTFLEPDGNGGWRKLSTAQSKLMLGQTRGAGTMLHFEFGAPMVVSEGIETGLSILELMQAEGRRVSVIAALSSSNMRGLLLPEPVRAGAWSNHLLPAPDPDEAGAKAASALGQRAVGLGWRVGRIKPPRKGGDWNDELRRSAGQMIKKGAA